MEFVGIAIALCVFGAATFAYGYVIGHRRGKREPLSTDALLDFIDQPTTRKGTTTK